MSELLRKVGAYIHLVLHSSKAQSEALLETATPIQIQALCEVFYNLFHLPLKGLAKSKLQSRKRVLKRLINKSLAVPIKTRLVHKHSRLIRDTLISVKKQLTQLLK